MEKLQMSRRDMERSGMVSLWLGSAPSKEALDAYLKYGFTPDGDYIPSAFMNDFEMRFYETALYEATFLPQPMQSIEELLRRNSDAKIIIPRFIGLLGNELKYPVNAKVLLYDFDYTGKGSSSGGAVRLSFVGKTQYK
jgi:hypothetical protein